ncbi:glutathione S-transferase [Sphingomonas kaistensis]|uniref:Glutathione S-transferase n=1 Tax=Sphingomonas kaistensis TaxID=298708 RepID=A0A7X6BGU7_9SPHN|nr:glutathione S-transferase N-terminal domain-containing protein [Sphingomonas kaistensis]NJC05422.1 glutathione S-transferase [Sphingomonas kaistensis]
MLKLFYSPGACSLVTHIALHEAEAEHGAVRIDFAAGEQRTPDYLAVNPHGRVPALVTDEGTITENLAILGYLADRFGAPGSVPRGDAFKTAKAMQMLSWLSGTVHATAFAALFRPARFTADESFHQGIKDGAHAALTSHFVELDDLCGDGWLAGDEYTAADSYAAVFYRWARAAKFDLTLYPRWTGLVSRVVERPAVVRAIAHEGLKIEQFA